MIRITAARGSGAVLAARGVLRRPLSALVSLEEEFKGSPTLAPHAVAPSTAVSKLSNGIPVVSRSTSGPSSAVALLLKAGSREEPAGATLLLQNMAFKTTEACSTLFLNRTLEMAAVYASASGGREATLYAAECPPGGAGAEAAMDAIAQTVLSPKMRPWEVLDTAGKVASVDLSLASSDAGLLLDDALHAAAFGEDSGLGKAYYSSCVLDVPSLAALAKGRAAASKMVLSGAGIPHEKLVELGEKFLASAPKSGASAPAPSPYVGGESRVKARGSGITQVVVAFGAPAASGAEAATAAVLEKLLQARLPVGAAAISIAYSDTGLLGATGSAPSGQVAAFVDTLCKALKSLATTEASSAEFAAAATAARLSALQSLEAPGVAAAALASAVAAGADPVAIGAASKVTAASAKALAAKILKTPVTIASVGDVSAVPRLAAVAAKF